MYFSFYLKKKVLNWLCLSMSSLVVIVALLIVFSSKQNVAVDIDSVFSKELPILMYHGLIKNKKHQNVFMIHPDIFENDLKYITEKGYTTITVQDLLDYVYLDKPLPEKPIMITFDDGYYNNYLYAFPLLKQYNCKIVLSPIGKYTDKYSNESECSADYSHVTWDQIREMIDSNLVEIQNHTYDMHSAKKPRIGCTKKKSETLSEYQNALVNDVTKMQNRVFDETGLYPSAFVFPFGAISKEAPNIIKNIGFKCTFCCEGRLNVITKDPECLYCLCRFIRPNSMKTEQYFSKILKIKPKKKHSHF